MEEALEEDGPTVIERLHDLFVDRMESELCAVMNLDERMADMHCGRKRGPKMSWKRASSIMRPFFYSCPANPGYYPAPPPQVVT